MSLLLNFALLYIILIQVSNAGGIGSIGGVGYTPSFLRKQLKQIKSLLESHDLPFGVDLLLPAVGSGARKTNYDYTKGELPELVDIIIESGARLVCISLFHFSFIH